MPRWLSNKGKLINLTNNDQKISVIGLRHDSTLVLILSKVKAWSKELRTKGLSVI